MSRPKVDPAERAFEAWAGLDDVQQLTFDAMVRGYRRGAVPDGQFREVSLGDARFKRRKRTPKAEEPAV